MKKTLSTIAAISFLIPSSLNVISCDSLFFKKQNKDKNDNIDDTNATLINATDASLLENRKFNHSNLKPTGYFLFKDSEYTVTLNRELRESEKENIRMAIGQYGEYNKDERIRQKDTNFMWYRIFEGNKVKITNLITNGVLYISDTVNVLKRSDLEVIEVTSNNNKIEKIPTFKINKTSKEEFINQIRTTNSPFVEFVSEHFIATMQTDMIKNEVLPYLKRDFNEILGHWDDTWHWTNELYGLNEKYNDINKKYNHYVHIANADTGVGFANAWFDRLMFHSGAGKTLFLDDLFDQWTLWHELGHTYQTSQYLWSGLTEVTVNISSLYIQQKLNLPLRIFKEGEKREAIKEYLLKPENEKSFDGLEDVDSTLWIKLGMFWQLQMGFGENFYPLLSQEYRKINQEPNSVERFSDDFKKQQEFMKISSKVSGYNLTPFFKKWGFYLSSETESIISGYKTLSISIWDNIVVEETKDYPIVQEYLKMNK